MVLLATAGYVCDCVCVRVCMDIFIRTAGMCGPSASPVGVLRVAVLDFCRQHNSRPATVPEMDNAETSDASTACLRVRPPIFTRIHTRHSHHLYDESFQELPGLPIGKADAASSCSDYTGIDDWTTPFVRCQPQLRRKFSNPPMKYLHTPLLLSKALSSFFTFLCIALLLVPVRYIYLIRREPT